MGRGRGVRGTARSRWMCRQRMRTPSWRRRRHTMLPVDPAQPPMMAPQRSPCSASEIVGCRGGLRIVAPCTPVQAPDLWTQQVCFQAELCKRFADLEHFPATWHASSLRTVKGKTAIVLSNTALPPALMSLPLTIPCLDLASCTSNARRAVASPSSVRMIISMSADSTQSVSFCYPSSPNRKHS